MHLKNSLAILALLLALATVQGPLWRPAAGSRSVTAKAGSTVIFPYEGEIERALIFQKGTAYLTPAGPGRLVIHANAPGKTRMLLRYKTGESRLYEVVILPA